MWNVNKWDCKIFHNMTNQCRKKGKSVERRRRKATGLIYREKLDEMIAGSLKASGFFAFKISETRVKNVEVEARS